MAAEVKTNMTIQKLRQSYDSGERTVTEVMEEVLQRIASEPRKNIWITLLTAEQIAAQIKTLDEMKKAGRPLPLYGIPFAIKDNIDLAGIPTTAACPAFAYTPQKSAYVVEKLLAAGAIAVGKTNLDQFATGLVGTRSPYGACENAFNPEYISGGSSAGSAVSVARDLVAFSLGTDTAGSGRVPASFNNLVGLKPTRGLLSTSGLVPACRSLDCISIFANSCADARLILKVVAGEDPQDPLSRTPPSSGLPQVTKGAVKIGVLKGTDGEFFGNEGAKTNYFDAIKCLKSLGHGIVEIDYSPFKDTAELLYEGPWVVERLLAAGPLCESDPAKLRPELVSILQGAKRFSAGDVFAGLAKLAGLRKLAEKQWEKMDVMLLPTAGTIYKIAEVEADALRLNRNLGYYTNFVNLLDLSAIAVPNGYLPSGLPFGVTFMAPAFTDLQLLGMGEEFHEQANKGAPV